MEYFTQQEFDLVRVHANQRYDKNSEAYRAFVSLRNKLNHWLTHYLNPFGETKLEKVRQERLNKQAGRGMKHHNFKDYILIGVAPMGMNKGKKLFVKLSFEFGAFAKLEGGSMWIHVDVERTSETTKASEALLRLTLQHEGHVGHHIPIDTLLGYGDWKTLTREASGKVEDSIQAYRDIYQEHFVGKPSNGQPTPVFEEHFQGLATNTILYGPPGTGKTYRAKAMAVAHALSIEERVLDELYNGDRAKIMEQYQALVSQGRIETCTFHPGMSYEDFVEGIKPYTEKATGEIGYQIEEGILKRVAERAQSIPSSDHASNFSLADLSNHEVFKLSLGNTLDAEEQSIYPYCIQHDVIAVGILNAVNLVDYAEGKQSFETLQQQYQQHTDMSGRGPLFLKYFIRTLKIGDYVIIGDGNRFYRAIGQVTGDYTYQPDTDISYNHFRSVKWLVKDVKIPVEEIYDTNFTQSVIYKLNKEQLRLPEPGPAPMKTKVGDKKAYVLLIDELNRGNVPQIFGELITLIEPDKRLDQAEEMTLTLPYSKVHFGLPPNLHLIATMNTSDRSVEALDAALRRRFQMEYVGPDYSVLVGLLEKSKKEHWDLDTAEYVKKHQELATEDGFYYNDPINHFEELKLPFTETRDLFPRLSQLLEERYELEEDDSIYLPLEHLLSTVNERLTYLLDEEHVLGPAFFLPLASTAKPMPMLRRIWYEQVIPQIEEFFWGDRARMQWVLGPDFVTKQEAPEGLFHTDAQPEGGLSPRYEVENLPDVEFAEALFRLAGYSTYDPEG